jgi:hypothetical protein
MMSPIRGKILNDEKLNRDTKVYRTLSVERLFQMFEEKINVVVRPSLWDDTFENLALSSVFDANGTTGTFSFKDDLYGQCWTLHTASDAIWRIYSNGTDGVRIRTTAGKLFDSLSADERLGSAGETHLGRVQYLSDTKLRKYADEHFVQSTLCSETIAQTLTIKRRAFSHEKEVRLIYHSDRPHDEKVLRYKIDPHALIDQIMLHPQLARVDAERLKSRIKRHLGYSGEVKRSLLYAPPKGFAFKIS